MNREEAKELLIHILMTYEPKDQYGDYDDPEPYEQALTMAIEALSQPIVAKCYEIDNDRVYCAPEMADKIYMALHEDTNVQNMHKGEWIFNPTDAIGLMFAKPKCSKCGFESSDGGNFCSNCGCAMAKEKKK